MAARYAVFGSQMKTFKMSNARGSTINHAFASALATADVYDERNHIERSMYSVDPTRQLRCVYCDAEAQTADHLHGLVTDSKYTGRPAHDVRHESL